MRNTFNYLSVLVGLFMSIGFGPVIARASAATGTIVASPVSASHLIGEEFDVAIVANGGNQHLSVARANVAVSNLTVVSLSLNQDIQWITVGGYTIPSTSHLNFDGGITGAGVSSLTMYTMRVRGVAAGNASITLSNGRLVSSDSEDVLSGVTNGSYTITAAANTADTVNPTVVINSPSLSQTISGTTAIRATASDDRLLSKVALSLDTTLLSSCTSSPCVFSLDTTKYSNGTHSIYAVATDGIGNQKTASIAVTINNQAAAASEPVVTSTDQNADTAILLNSFQDFLAQQNQTGQGKALDLSLDQVIYFDVTKSDATIERHSATVKEVGDGYIVVTFASTPQNIRMTVGQTVQVDVDGDGANDIEATLNSITSGKANMTYRQLVKAAQSEITAPVESKPEKSKAMWYYWIAGAFLIIALLLVYLKLRVSKNTDKEKNGEI
ncbi:MAG: Ig-like domain-containing protein [Candidatus Berkelbacteria bacterium]|nr:Ig-like domain-containing protein [Candidatus Berkelbacteria bacterium]